ncbi:MAG: SpoIIE family protein phosphatase, partial [Bacteroidetes bacterium]|nr:SpoIIE family protein phosphatase [Bacteroidota bacterium]
LAYEYKEKYSQLNDSIYSGESLKQIADMQTKYETEKKEKEIQLLTREKEVKELQLDRNRILITSISIGFILVLIISFILYNRFRIKKKANILLTLQKNEIEQQKKEITDSIRYARRIQAAILPPEEVITSIIPDHFILFKPKDIVSGDFYWATTINIQGSRYARPYVSTALNTILVVAAADCTGHGVPGAFMSMLGVVYLNEIVNRMDKLNPGEILDHLRTSVINSLRQTGKTGESQDGMDIALCVIDTGTREIQYAGANNPLYIIPADNRATLATSTEVNDHIAQDTDGLFQIRADRMPIGIHRKVEKPFTNNILSLSSGDTLYIFSDGFYDQFGGPGPIKEKFKSKNFRNLLVTNRDKSMKEQCNILDRTFVEWKGDQDQVDDVLIIGIRI